MTEELSTNTAPKVIDLTKIAPEPNKDVAFLKEKLRRVEIRAELAIFDARVRNRNLNVPIDINLA